MKVLTKATPVICLALVGLAGCTAPRPDASGWLEALVEDRAIKDEWLGQDPQSPVPVERRGALLPINYYDPDPTFRVAAALEVSPDEQIFDIPYSTGQIFAMQRVGVLKFALNGQPMQLSALAEAPVRSIDSLFIMFKDTTNDTETYGGGRYLDLPRTASGIYELDFNRAYNPNCYYDESWECPVPPRENWLDVPIRAGELLAPGFDGPKVPLAPAPESEPEPSSDAPAAAQP